MGIFRPDTWKQQWETFLNAPYIIASFMAVAGAGRLVAPWDKV
jgi:hypothetical protein